MSVSVGDIKNNLDVEFRQVLYIIRPYITHINNNYHLEKYRVWLERLNNANPAEKFERNQYLIELANQIHDNVLKTPFVYDPPTGPLPKLQHFQRHQEGSEDEEWPSYSCQNLGDAGRTRSKRFIKTKPKETLQKTKAVARPFQKIGQPSCDVTKGSETSSWCDLSDSAAEVTLGAGDVDDEDDKNQKNEKKSEEDKDTCSLLTVEERNERKPTQEELEALKQRVKDLLEVKNALKDTHCLTEDRKKTVENLEKKVDSLEKQNAELRFLLEENSKKFVEVEMMKTKELNDFKDKCSLLRKKELEYLQKQHKAEVEQFQKLQSSEISLAQSEIQQQLDTLKREYEKRIKTMVYNNIEVLKEKNEEIDRLKEELKMKESQPSNEQVISLKRCISKLDKVLHKNEKDYIRKIERLKQELEVKEIASQMQLQTQRADLIVRSSTTKQEELRNAINLLESKYKKIMEHLQVQASEKKKNDEKVIEDLKSLLERHNIAY